MTLKDREDSPTKAGRKRGPGKWIAIAGIAVALAGGAGVAAAVSGDGELRAETLLTGWGGGGHHGMPGHHRGMAIGHMLEELDLTDAQEGEIWKIAGEIRGEAAPLFRELRDTRGQIARLLAAPAIDPVAIEALRAERIRQLDEASRKLVASLTRAAEVLTAEQRAELARKIGEHGPRGRW